MLSEQQKIVEHALVAQAQKHLESVAQEPVFLKGLRKESLERFQDKGLPHAKEERYRYSPMQKLYELWTTSRTLPPQIDTDLAVAPSRTPSFIEQADGYHLRLIQGVLSELPPGLPFQVLTLVKACEVAPQLVQKWFSQQATKVKDSFVDLNTLFFVNGLFLYVPPQTQLTKPIILHHLLSGLHYERVCFIMGEDSECTFIEASTGGDEKAFLSRTMEVVLGEKSRFNFYALQHGGTVAHQLRYTLVHQEAYSHFFHHLSASQSKSFVRDELRTSLQQHYSCATLQGLYRIGAEQHLALHLGLLHKAPHSSSHQYYKGVGSAYGTALFEGHIHIQPDAQKSTAQQKHAALLLSPQAVMNARPQLSIEADDVRCSHGATTTPLDPDMLFYLGSRGILPDAAQEILIESFGQEVIEKIPSEMIQKMVARM